jgi:hypothetical protein
VQSCIQLQISEAWSPSVDSCVGLCCQLLVCCVLCRAVPPPAPQTCRYGADPDALSPKGWSPLSYAKACGKYGPTEERGIYPEVRWGRGKCMPGSDPIAKCKGLGHGLDTCCCCTRPLLTAATAAPDHCCCSAAPTRMCCCTMVPPSTGQALLPWAPAAPATHSTLKPLTFRGRGAATSRCTRHLESTVYCCVGDLELTGLDLTGVDPERGSYQQVYEAP